MGPYGHKLLYKEDSLLKYSFFICSKNTTTTSETTTQNDPPASKSPKKPELHDVVEEIINHCLDKDITNPVEVLRIAQNKIVTGRALEVKDPSSSDEGLTNYILINRKEVFKSAMEELGSIEDLRSTLEVSFYGETAKDLGNNNNLKPSKHPHLAFCIKAFLKCLSNYFLFQNNLLFNCFHQHY